MRIATVNVNGIRASVRRGFTDWLAERSPDLIALQEVRAPAELVPIEASTGYHFAYHPGNRAGRNGVALLCRTPPIAVREGFGSGKFDPEGRYLEADYDLNGWKLSVGSLYLPKGGRADDTPEELARYRHKLAFMKSFRPYLTKARLAARARGREFLVMGDFNIAHTRLDLRNWRGNAKSVGFLPEEREWLGSVQSPRTLVDVVRRLHPDADGPYSWWSWMGNAFNNDTGWRIDYHFASPELAAAAQIGGTDRAESYPARISDHAPVVVDYANRN
ncbi:exodeoxyribonuclease III [Propionicimonas sp.]|jgi:exodeoxyribonuclease-3|uniref:exodeoxyribonuclease III n=1 Tax=Propionicimonas sp. TaxID=1955623 RepID=UPI001844DB0F|nr:exodeoxyribonuclease III [Propionicimonas sp.]MBU3977720.1 exodeoxyribonuclease III [Actinomycetota bacterium]MBA3021643.1 exodeoxyribonuclease III [Propionicimonas sp.]MBU3987194.1 exodeoxyribonuclease III [Actinomycetota bacterium]MBU4009015.1 exodeoxyribonuclease III [Actinomycetota bacterium]MBU4065835.1 exodeoxyribonuclease III [Actinomycetota bacterium]